MIQETLDSRRALLERSELAYHLTLQGAAHNTFTSDLLMLKKLLPLVIPASQSGRIYPDRALTIIPAYVVAFFDQHVKGGNSPLLEASAEAYPEVELKVYGE